MDGETALATGDMLVAERFHLPTDGTRKRPRSQNLRDNGLLWCLFLLLDNSGAGCARAFGLAGFGILVHRALQLLPRRLLVVGHGSGKRCQFPIWSHHTPFLSRLQFFEELFVLSALPGPASCLGNLLGNFVEFFVTDSVAPP